MVVMRAVINNNFCKVMDEKPELHFEQKEGEATAEGRRGHSRTKGEERKEKNVTRGSERKKGEAENEVWM